MKVYKTQSEVEKDVKNGVLAIEGDVKFECSISISASIVVTAGDITARDINAWHITAWHITAGDITAWDIKAWDITAGDILYFAFCCVYKSIKCFSIKARREKFQAPICLEGSLEITSRKEIETITIGNNKYNKEEVEQALKNIKSI